MERLNPKGGQTEERQESQSKNEKAKEAFAELGISFKPGSFTDIYRLTSRDTGGSSYPYNAGFTEFGKIRNNWILEKDGVEIGYYYTGLGGKAGQYMGEVGMIHLAPAIRNKGLASLVLLLGYMELVEGGAKELRAVLGDETGKIEGLLEKFGFVPTEERVGIPAQPVWHLNVVNSQEMLSFLEQSFRQRREGMNPETVQFEPETIDIDNPRRVSVEEVVYQRLQQNGWQFAGTERFLFGYPHAPVIVYQENLIDGTTRLVLRVEGKREDDKKILEEILKNNLFAGSTTYPYPLNARGKTLKWEVESPHLKTKRETYAWAKRLVVLGEDFFTKSS